MKKRVLFIDRDGTIVSEPPIDYQLDNLNKLEFIPKVFKSLAFLRERMDYEQVMASNQDGLGTSSFPEDSFKMENCNVPSSSSMFFSSSNEAFGLKDLRAFFGIDNSIGVYSLAIDPINGDDAMAP